jgi:hypothetical protein
MQRQGGLHNRHLHIPQIPKGPKRLESGWHRSSRRWGEVNYEKRSGKIVGVYVEAGSCYI